MSAVPELSAHSAPALQAGDQLGRYQLLCAIAQGGMGVVWAARENGRLGLPRLVAIKTALPHTQASFERVQDFLLDEAQVAASIDHPNVCKILELGQEGSSVFIAMEWIQGVSLQSFLRCTERHRLDYGIAAHVVAQACSGMHAAHELTDDDGVPLEVVHRDATPHNLLVNTNGEVKIIDFGIVKSRNQLHQATQLGEIKGKIAYLAPEQLRGAKIDRRSDIFSLGCVLYVATTGRGPFAANDAGSTITRIMQGSYAPPSALFADYPKRLEAIVMKALDSDPAKRFQTAEEMRAALEAFISDSQPKPTRADVAALLSDCCGALIEERRQEIRAAQKLFESQAGSARGSSGKIEAARSGTYPVNDSSTETLAAEIAVEVLDADARPSSEGPAAERLPERRTRRVLLGAVLILTCAFGASAGVWLKTPRAGFEPVPPVVSAASSPRTQPASKSELIRITVQATPKGARMTLDGGPELKTPQTFAVERDERPHLLVVRADGHDDATRSIRFDQAQALFIALAPQGNAERASAPRSRKLPRASKRSPAKIAEHSAHEATSVPAGSVEQGPPSAVKEPFADPLVRQPPRHTIDPTDPFEK